MPSRFWAALLLLAAAGGCSGSNVNVYVPTEGDGNIEGSIELTGDHPPIEGTIDEGGLKGITPLPAVITPIIPITGPDPTATPRPR